MKFRAALFSFILIGLFSCSREAPLEFISDSFTEDSFELCKSIGCPEITINYIEATGDEVVSGRINKAVQDFIIASLNFGEDSIPKAKTIEEAASEFIKIYRMHSADFPDMSAEYFAEINVTESYKSDKVISLETRQYLYTGGAHGYGSVTFLNIDPETGEEIPLERLFKNKSGFTAFCEEKFRVQNDIPKGETINSTGFWFEDDIFYIPESIGYTNQSLILIYNAYEISSYAAGAVELEIPMDEANPFLIFK